PLPGAHPPGPPRRRAVGLVGGRAVPRRRGLRRARAVHARLGPRPRRRPAPGPRRLDPRAARRRPAHAPHPTPRSRPGRGRGHGRCRTRGRSPGWRRTEERARVRRARRRRERPGGPMTAIRLGLSELRRLAAGTLPRLAILAMALIPTLYAGLYLFANHDPYDKLDQVPAALVVLDEGTTTTDAQTGATTRRDFGRDVADQLLDDGGFGWVETSQVDAEYGVRSGRYDAALVIGPTFSADLASAGEFEPQQASLTLVTNDANNYL